MTVRQVFQKGSEAFNAHDIDGFTALLADDATFHAPGDRSGTGKAACAEFYGNWLTAFPDAHVEINGLHITDEAAIEEGTFTGTHQGTLLSPTGDIPPTGRSVHVEYIQVLRVRDGRHVVSFNLMFDRLLMLQQLGLAPALAVAT
jgi:steroid delta-isomerase-like uncharacterized protein